MRRYICVACHRQLIAILINTNEIETRVWWKSIRREKKKWLLLLFAHARTCIVSRVSHLALIYLYLSCVLLGESVCVYSDTDPIEWWDFINHFNMRQKDVLSTASACSETHLKGERSATCCIHIRRHCHRLRTVCDFPVRKKSRDVDLNERNHCERTAMTTKIRFEKSGS